jgi:hypothetical protein
MPPLDLFQLLALMCVLAGLGIVAWGVASGRLRVQGRRGVAVLLALLFLPIAVTRDTLLNTDSGAGIMLTMAIVFVWGRHLVPPRRAAGAEELPAQ